MDDKLKQLWVEILFESTIMASVLFSFKFFGRPQLEICYAVLRNFCRPLNFYGVLSFLEVIVICHCMATDFVLSN